MKKKIAHIVESTATGTLSMLRVLANSQALQGHEVQIIYSKREETPENLFEMFDSSISLIHIPMNSVFNNFTALIQIRRKVIENNTEQVILHSSFAGFIGRLSLLGLKCKCYFVPHCISFMRKDIGDAKRSLFILLEWVASLKNCAYIACSKSEQEQISKAIPFRDCHLVENALDVTQWDVGLNNQRLKQVVTVGQIRTQKNPKLLAEIARKSKDIGYEFIWVGDGNDESAKQELVDAGVKVLGWKNQDEIKDILSQSEIYLSTASWEGLPVSPLEAMLCGCVAVLSNCSGNKDIIEHAQNGYLFDESDEAVSFLRALYSKDDTRILVSNSGREHVKNHYRLDRYTQEMQELVG
ncbi:glycosyltransferase [Vibrio lentus]|nr:glycosyltransferase [Vibrio lentus]PMH95979.1 hypothetical protein BCU54_11890 [Vibrio lentus]